MPSAQKCFRSMAQWDLAEEGDEQSRLNSSWTDAILGARVPGSIHAALEKAGKIPDPKFARNDVLGAREEFQDMVWMLENVSQADRAAGHRLIFDGVAIHCTVFGSTVSGSASTKACLAGLNSILPDRSVARSESTDRPGIDPAPPARPNSAPTHNTGWAQDGCFQQRLRLVHYSDIPGAGYLAKLCAWNLGAP